MGDDDANAGGPGECPVHDFGVEELVLVAQPGRLFPGLGMELTCSRCGAVAYERSRVEQ